MKNQSLHPTSPNVSCVWLYSQLESHCNNERHPAERCPIAFDANAIIRFLHVDETEGKELKHRRQTISRRSTNDWRPHWFCGRESKWNFSSYFVRRYPFRPAIFCFVVATIVARTCHYHGQELWLQSKYRSPLWTTKRVHMAVNVIEPGEIWLHWVEERGHDKLKRTLPRRIDVQLRDLTKTICSRRVYVMDEMVSLVSWIVVHRLCRNYRTLRFDARLRDPRGLICGFVEICFVDFTICGLSIRRIVGLCENSIRIIVYESANRSAKLN